MKTILVTGAAGFLGTLVTGFLSGLGHQVTALTRTSESAQELSEIFGGITVFAADITDFDGLPKRSFDCVVHLAGLCETRVQNYSPANYALHNIRGTENVLRAFDSGHFIFHSSAKLYASSSDEVNESSSLGPHATPYTQSQAAAERICLDSGLNCTVLRCTGIFGPGRKINSVVPSFFRQAFAGNDIFLMDSPERRLQILYFKDYLSALQCLVHRPICGVFNLAPEEQLTLSDLAEKVRIAARSRSRIVSLPSRSGYLTPRIHSRKFAATYDWTPRYEMDAALLDFSRWVRPDYVSTSNSDHAGARLWEHYRQVFATTEELVAEKYQQLY